MQNIRITKEAELLLCTLYDTYRKRRKNGMLIEDAAQFGSSEMIQTQIEQDLPTNDIDHMARLLARKGLLICQFADDALNECYLSQDGIMYMEHRFSDRLDRLSKHIATLRTLIFG